MAGQNDMTKRKQIRLCLLMLLTLMMAAGLVGAFATWGGEAWIRLELWLCLLGIITYLCLGLRLVIRKRGSFLLGDILESNLVCTALYMLILEYWVFPMQVQMTGGTMPEETLYRLVGRMIPFAILIGWILLGRRGAGGAKTLIAGGIVPLAYWIVGRQLPHHPYFFFDAMLVGEKGLWEWSLGWLLLLPLLLLLMASAEYAVSMLGLYPAAKKNRKQNINGRGMTK